MENENDIKLILMKSDALKKGNFKFTYVANKKSQCHRDFIGDSSTRPKHNSFHLQSTSSKFSKYIENTRIYQPVPNLLYGR